MASQITAAAVLTDARSRFATQGATVDLDKAVGAGPLLDELRAVLGASPTLTGADTTAADGSGNFSVSGKARWLHYDALQVKFTFFASNGDAGDALQCLIAVTDPVPSWNVGSDFKDLPGYVDLSPQGVTKGLQPSFLTTIDFKKVAFKFSSYDLSKPATLTVSDSPAAGLAFTGTVDAVAGVWDTVTQIAGTLGTLSISGVVTNLTEAPELAVRCSFTGASLTLSKEIALDLTALVIRSGLSASTPVGPSLEIDARLKNPLHPLDLSVRFGIGSSKLAIEAAFEDGGVFSLNDLAGLLGLDANGLGDALPGGAAFGQLGLSSLSIDATLSPASVDRVRVMVTTERPWVIVDDRVTVTPMLLFDVDNRSGGGTTLELAGLWTLGKSRLQVYALIATGDVVARLAPGSTLDVDELFKTMLPDVTLPKIELVDLDVRLNYLTKSFSLTVEAASDWTVPLGPASLAIEDIRFAADYSGGKITHVGLTGRLALAQLQLVLSGDYVPDASTIRGEARTDGPLDIGTLIGDLQRELTGGGAPPVDIPADLVQLNVESAFIEYQQAGQVLSLGCDVTHVLKLGTTFSIDEFALQLSFASATLKSAHVLARLTVCDVELILQSTKQETGWLFEGSTAVDKEIRLGDVVADLAKKFTDFEAPPALRQLTVSNLKLSFDSEGKKFTFGCMLKAPVGDSKLDVDLEIALTREKDTFTAEFSGFVTIGGLKFELLLEAIKSAGTDGAVPKSSSMVLAAVQPGQKIDVRALVAGIDADAGALMPALSIGLANALVIYRQTDSEPATWLFGLALDAEADLSTLPLVGSVFGDRKLGGIKDIQVLYASTPVVAKDVVAYNRLLTKAKAKPPLPIAQDATDTTQVLQPGFNFAAKLDLGDAPVQLGAGGATAPTGGALTAASAPPPAPPSGNATWIDVKKSIGPVTLVRVGVRYESGRVWLLLSADFVVAGLSLGLEGLALGMKLSDLKDIAVNLDGMSLDFESGPLTISGGFLRVGGDYLGQAKVKAASFGLTAIGGYAPAEQSFFIFVRLDVPLGGPPFFFVTGIAGGFGVNRSLKLPPIDDLTGFALLPANSTFPTKLDSDAPGKSLAQTLKSTAEYIEPSAGQNWAAAGIDFSSFEMVQSSALVTVAFGVEFAVALLGICRITVPKADPEPIVYLEITLLAQLKPAQGVLAVDGRITPASYLFARLCRITGGFAFYLWFAGPHEGDFVISVGGYHPRFKKPDHYPVVPRMQLVYQIGGLVIKGQCYLALTPHMVMAGMQLDATWSSGNLKAWFSAGVDFLLGWRPFHYEADAYVHIGVSLKLDLLFTTITITIHVGVDLSIWGPPFGGKATIDLDIISFTINFGAQPRKETVDWPGFKASFLPAGADKAAAPAQPVRQMGLAAAAAGPQTATDGLLCTAKIADGLVLDLKAKDPTEFFSWLVDANHFAIDSNTLIPAKQATYNAVDLQTPFTKAAGFKPSSNGAVPAPAYDEVAFPNGVAWANEFGVLPMGLTAEQFSTQHIVRIARATKGADYTVAANYVEDVNDVAVGPLVKPAAAALWAASDPGLNGERLIAGTLAGLRVSPMAQHPDITLKADLWAMLFDQNQEVDWRGSVPPADRQDPYRATTDGPTLSFQLGGEKVTNQDYKLTALTDEAPATARHDLVSSLNSLGFAFEPDAIDVADLAAYPLWDWPMIRTLGAEVAPS